MTPPLRTDRARHGSGGASSSVADIPAFLSVENLFRDPADTADPAHYSRQWQDDQLFRTQHTELYLALDTLRSIFRGRTVELTASQRESLSAFRAIAEDGDPRHALEALVLRNLRAALADAGADFQARARAVSEVVGAAPGASSGPAATSTGGASGDSFRLGAIYVTPRFDYAYREALSAITARALPAETLPGYNQASDFGFSAGAEFLFRGFHFFADLNMDFNMTPAGAPAAHFNSYGIRFGLRQYDGQNRRDGFHLTLGGRETVGLGIHFTHCTGVDGMAAPCSGDTAQFSFHNYSDMIGLGYGPFELSLRVLLPTTTYVNTSSATHLPTTNRFPFEFDLTYHINPPDYRPAEHGTDPEAVLRETVTTPQIVFDLARIGIGAFQQNEIFRQEAGFEFTRELISRGAFGYGSARDAQYNLLNLGSFVGGGLSLGVANGNLANNIRRDLQHGGTVERILLSGALLAEAGVHTGIVLANERQSLGIPTIQTHASSIALPIILGRDALGLLGAFGVFGDRARAVRSGDIWARVHYLGAHTALALLGFGLAFSSGDGSGIQNNFLQASILGNVAPPPGTTIEGSPYSFDAQRWHYARLSWGGMLLTYGASGIIDYIGLSGRYAEAERLREAETRGRRSREGSEGSAPAAGLAPRLSLGLHTDGQSYLMGTVGGTF